MIITIPGDPVPKARHRSVLRNGKIFQYDIQEKEKIHCKNQLRILLNEQYDKSDNGNQMEIASICSADYYHVEFDFFLKIAKGATKKNKEKMLLGEIKHNHKSDIDNYVKFYLDCGNEILWQDDAMIYSLRAEKHYSNYPSTVIKITTTNKKE